MENSLVSNEQLNEALADQWQYGGRLGTILIDKCMIDEKTFLRVLSAQLGVPGIILLGRTIKEQTLQLIPKDLAWKYLVVPVEARVVNGRKALLLAMADPTDALAIEVMEKVSGHHVKPVLAFDNTIRMALMEFYETQYGRGDLTLRRRSEPDSCEHAGAAAARESRPPDVSAYLGRDPAGDETFPADPDGTEKATESQTLEAVMQPDSEAVIERLSLELQAMLDLLVRKGIFKPGEHADELRKIKSDEG